MNWSQRRVVLGTHSMDISLTRMGVLCSPTEMCNGELA